MLSVSNVDSATIVDTVAGAKNYRSSSPEFGVRIQEKYHYFIETQTLFLLFKNHLF